MLDLVVVALLCGQARPKPTPKPTVAPPVAIKTKLAPCWSVAFSPDGARLAVGSYKKVVVYETANWSKAAEWPIAGEAVRAVAFSGDGKRLAAATGVVGKSGSVFVLDAQSGQVTQTLASHKDVIEAVAFTGDRLICAADDERVSINELGSGKVIGSLSEHNGRCLSVAVPLQTNPDAGGQIFASGGADKMLKIWDAELRRVVVNFDQCSSAVWSLCALPQAGRFLAGSGDGALRVFGVRADGKATAPNQPAPRAGYVAQTMGGAHDGPVYAVAASTDGRFYISGGSDHKVILWNSGGGKMKEFTESTDEIWSVATDNRRIAAASSDGHVRIYDIAMATLTKELP